MSIHSSTSKSPRPRPRYERGAVLGEGSWGVVYLASRAMAPGLKEDSTAPHMVAIKRIKPSPVPKEGVNFTALREIKYLRELRHENIIDLVDVYIADHCVHLVFELCITDLEKVILSRDIFISPADAKAYMSMMLRALAHCHAHFVLHRDIKPSNMLITSGGVLKLTDFGLARTHGSPNKLLTDTVVTLWYKSPELLFHSTLYGEGVDMWALGCIFAELILRQPLFPGSTELEQCSKIFNILGTPEVSDWPGCDLLPTYVQFETRTPLDLTPLFGDQTDAARELLHNLLQLNPNKRWNAQKCLQSDYFTTTAPAPTSPGDLPLPLTSKSIQEAASSQGAVKSEAAGQVPASKKARGGI